MSICFYSQKILKYLLTTSIALHEMTIFATSHDKHAYKCFPIKTLG